MRYSLTEEEAKADGERLINSLADAFTAPLRKLAEPFAGNKATLVFKTGGRVLFERTLAALELIPGAEVKLPEPFTAQDLIETLKTAVLDMYAYCNGEDRDPEPINVAMGGCYWYLSDYFARSVKLRKSYDELFEEKIGPRFAAGYRMFKARENFESAFKYECQCFEQARHPAVYFERDNENLIPASVTPTNLALVGGVVYTYIIKLIRADKMRAFKVRFEWMIPFEAAIEWLSDRDDIPDWTKLLIERYDDQKAQWLQGL